jgi:hypothetical protein
MTSIRFMALWLSLVLATLSYAAPPRAQGGAFRMDTKKTKAATKKTAAKKKPAKIARKRR